MGRERAGGPIIEECLKRHGEGEVFHRTDGLAFYGWRAIKRAAYLREHPETRPERRELIKSAGVTPGMTRDEAVAAWGLIEDDTRDLDASESAEGGRVYARLRGLHVGRPYTLYLIDDTVVGVRAETEDDADEGDAADAPEGFPPEEWFAAVAAGAPQRVACRDIEGETEHVEAEWVDENVFRILEIPLLVNGVTLWDEVEARWEGDDPTPRFARVRRRSTVRLVRVRASEREVDRLLSLVESYKDELAFPTTRFMDCGLRYGRGVLVFCMSEFTLAELTEIYGPRLPDLLLGPEGFYTDTGAREWVFTDTGGRE